MDTARAFLPRSVDVFLVGTGQAADGGDVSIGVHLVADVLGDVAHRLEVVRRRDGEAGLDVVSGGASSGTGFSS